MRLLTTLLFLPILAVSQSNILYYESAEESKLFATYVSKQTTTSYGITSSTSQFYSGTKSARFELRDGDKLNNNGTRAEISFPAASNLNRWYAYAIFFPSADYKYDTDDEVITQWHQGGNATPALCLRTKKDHIYLRVMGNIWVDLGTIIKDKWQAYVIHVKHSSGSTGLIEIWRDGAKILSRTGPNMYKVGGDFKNPNLKLGIYKSGWNDSKTTMTRKRLIYFDEIKIGNENATLEEMTPKR